MFSKGRNFSSSNAWFVLTISLLVACSAWLCWQQFVVIPRIALSLNEKFEATKQPIIVPPDTPKRSQPISRLTLQSLPNATASNSVFDSVSFLSKKYRILIGNITAKLGAVQDGSQFARTVYVFNASGPYPELVRFLSDLYAELDTLAIESMNVRQSSFDGQVDAELKLVLFHLAEGS